MNEGLGFDPYGGISETDRKAANENLGEQPITGQIRERLGKFSNTTRVGLALLAGGFLYGCGKKEEVRAKKAPSPVEVISSHNSPEELEAAIGFINEHRNLIWNEDKVDTEGTLERLAQYRPLINQKIAEAKNKHGVQVPESLVCGLLFIESQAKSDAISPGIKRKGGNWDNYVGMGQLGIFVAEQHGLKTSRELQNQYNLIAREPFRDKTQWQRRNQKLATTLEKWKTYDERFDLEKNIEATVKHLVYLSDIYQGDWQLAIQAHHSGRGNVDDALRLYLEFNHDIKIRDFHEFGAWDKNAVKSDEMKKIEKARLREAVKKYKVGYTDLMLDYLNDRRGKFDTHDEMRSWRDDGKNYSWRVLAASATAWRYFYNYPAYEIEKRQMQNSEWHGQTMSEKRILRQAEKGWVRYFSEYQGSKDIRRDIDRGELVTAPERSEKLGFKLDENHIGSALTLEHADNNRELFEEVKLRYRHTHPETMGLIFDVAKRYRERAGSDAPPLNITSLTRSLAYQKLIGGMAAKEDSNHGTGHAFDIGLPSTFEGVDRGQTDKMKLDLIEALKEIQGENEDIIWLAEPIKGTTVLHVSIGPRSVEKYRNYYLERIEELRVEQEKAERVRRGSGQRRAAIKIFGILGLSYLAWRYLRSQRRQSYRRRLQ